MTITVLNDLHLGVGRVGGTTDESAGLLREYAQTMYKTLLGTNNYVAINGDMFDTYQVPTSELLMAYLTTTEWLMSFGVKLWLIPGNHDLAKNSANLSSFELLARLLESQFPDKVKYCHGANWVCRDHGVYAISHLANQDLFDAALAEVPVEAKYLLLHCNYDNTFAGQSDHSLNLDRSVAKALTKNGMTLVLGHEHQCRTLMNDKVVIVGNQFPTSVSDCLAHGDAQKDGRKYMLQIYGDDMELVPTWSAKGDAGGYVEVEWDNLDIGNADFIRVVGKVEASQSADVIKAISKLRQTTNAFVITNAVKVEAVDGMDELAESVEDIRAVNVIELLMEQLDPDQQVVVRALLAGAV